MAITVDSPRCWKTSDLRITPIAFLMPTSLSLLDARAVDKFMKFIQAITRIKIAMMENNKT
jgi:hypothetical protein